MAATSLQRGEASLATLEGGSCRVPEAVVTVLCTCYNNELIKIIPFLSLKLMSNVSMSDFMFLHIKPYDLSHLQYAVQLTSSYFNNIPSPRHHDHIIQLNSVASVQVIMLFHTSSIESEYSKMLYFSILYSIMLRYQAAVVFPTASNKHRIIALYYPKDAQIYNS